MENMQNMIWLQFGGFFIAVLGLGLAAMVYLTRQFNRLADLMENLEQRQARLEERMDQRFDLVDQHFDRLEKSFDRLEKSFDRLEKSFDRLEKNLSQLQIDVKSLGEGLQNVEKEQARMLGYLEGRGVMGKARTDVETVS